MGAGVSESVGGEVLAGPRRRNLVIEDVGSPAVLLACRVGTNGSRYRIVIPVVAVAAASSKINIGLITSVVVVSSVECIIVPVVVGIRSADYVVWSQHLRGPEYGGLKIPITQLLCAFLLLPS